MPTSDTLVHAGDIAWEDLGDGIRRKILCHEDKLLMARVEFQKGAVGTPHAHPHVQGAYVESGRFEVTIDGRTEVLEAGDCFRVPSGVTHGAVALEAGVLIDVFTPTREDFFA